MIKYDYLVVGAGFLGSVFAHEAINAGKTVLVIDKRNHIGGNCYTQNIDGINVHKYGAHIFHTNNLSVWEYVNRFAPFNRFTNSPIANYKGELYNLPFNMNTFYQMWAVKTPLEAKAKIAQQVAQAQISEPKNLEEQAIKLVGTDIYQKLIKGYTEKQWGKQCTQLPPFIIQRLPLRFTYDNNYFNDKYQGIPIGGYTQIFEKLLSGADVRLGVDFLSQHSDYENLANKVIYSGMIDKYYNFKLGNLAYRSLKFETQIMDTGNFQGNAVINYTDSETPYTRVIEHKHFEFGQQPQTVVTYEYPQQWNMQDEPYYGVNDETNTALYNRYKELAEKQSKVIFGGRLGKYQYYDMDKTIAEALLLAEQQLK